jgi:hypothetical protein
MAIPHFSGLLMATQLFKDGASVFVETNRVQAHLQAGWSPSEPGKPSVKHPSVIYPASLKIDTLPQAEAEAVVLKEMGITPKLPAPAAVIGPPVEEPKPKRKYNRKPK